MDEQRIDDVLRGAARSHAGSVRTDPDSVLDALRPELRRSRNAHRARVLAVTGAFIAVVGGFALLAGGRTQPESVVAGPGVTPTPVVEPTPTARPEVTPR